MVADPVSQTYIPNVVWGYAFESTTHLRVTTSKRLADRKVEKFEKNIKKRGSVPETTTKKKDSYPVGPIVLGFFIFVVIGSYHYINIPCLMLYTSALNCVLFKSSMRLY
ncbi:stress-associated endoplasmic reticulum protein 2-like protein [Tanacetum coccineum]